VIQKSAIENLDLQSNADLRDRKLAIGNSRYIPQHEKYDIRVETRRYSPSTKRNIPPLRTNPREDARSLLHESFRNDSL